MSASQAPQALLERVQTLRNDILSNCEELTSIWHPLIERTTFLDSALNLASYLALRRHDLRDLQLALMQWGLSSLGRSESRVQPALNAVIATLGAICDADPSTLPPYPDKESFFQGSRIIASEAELLFGQAKASRTTRIMVTLPTEAAQDLELMTALLQANMECVRINCAHDDAETWEGMLRTLRLAESELGLSTPVRVLMDLGGPKVRTVRSHKSEKEKHYIGDKLLLTRAFDPNAKEKAKKQAKPKKIKIKLSIVGCTLHEALDQLAVGERVYIDDGQIGARVIGLVTEGAVLEIFQAPSKGRKIRSDKGLNFPDTLFTVMPLTDKDRIDLDFVVQHADMVGYSFVQADTDVLLLLEELAQRVPPNRQSPSLVLKIETKQAVRNLPALIVQAAGKLPLAVMIARGDLAIELGFQRMAEMQEEILWLCEAAHVPVIWATQVLETLTKEGLPTRAEVTDAAMANRAECVMLNKGPHIVDAVQMLDVMLTRMEGHQHKKTPQLRALHAWEDVFAEEEASGVITEATEDRTSNHTSNSPTANLFPTESPTEKPIERLDKQMRLAIAEIGQETCHFTSMRTTVDTFRQYGWYEGEEILSKRGEGAGYVAGFLQAAEEEGIDLQPVPIVSGWASANGPLTPETVQFLLDKVEGGLKAAGKVDGFFFGLHGAAAAENEPDVEGVLLQTARRVLGPDVPIVVPFDHHGIMTHLKMANLNGLVGHRTQPHMPFDTGYWAAKQLFAIVRGDVRPTIAWHRVPMIAHQEQFLTERGPMKVWFDRARELEKMDQVVSVSTFPMQPWLDVAEGGWNTVVVTNNDQALANKLSAELAQMVWDMREQFWVYESIPVEDAVKRAVAAEKGLVILSDTGDSVFGGATGDSTVILRELIKQQVPDLSLVSIVDAASVDACWNAGVGSTLDLVLGGKQDTIFGKPLEVKAKVLGLGDGIIEVTMGISSEYNMGKRALLEIGNVRLVVSENVGVGGNHPSVYQSFGIEPATAKIAVLKTASNFQYYKEITAEVVRVDSVGPTMSHLDQFNWQHLPRPIYPLDDLPTWQATPENANVV